MITPQLIDAVIKVESNYVATAVSPKGAKGLMQLMDGTGKEVHKKLELSEPYDPFNPEQNRLLGTEYLKHQFEKFNDVRLALAAYNAGPGRVSGCLGKHRKTSYQGIEKHLPKETQKYVASVLACLGESVAHEVDDKPKIRDALFLRFSMPWVWDWIQEKVNGLWTKKA